MNFCHVINNAYTNELLVLMTSIFDNCKGGHTFYILSKELSIVNKQRLEECVKDNNSNINFIDVDDSCLGEVPLKRKDFNKTPYYKLLLPVLLDSIDRVLYMDVDMIVIKDLSILYHMDMKNKPLAAVPDPLVNTRDYEYLKKMNVNTNSGERYFNSGLILFDLVKMKEMYTLDIALDYIKDNGSTFKFHDQEVLNGLFGKNYLCLNEKYNYLTIFRGIKDLIKYLLGLERKQLKSIAVLHYANQTKPWKRNYIGKFEEYFWKYARKSSIYNEICCNEKNVFKEQFLFLLSVLKRKMNL